MILSDIEILAAQKAGKIQIDPFKESRLNPNSYNLTLADKLVCYTDPVLDCKKEPKTVEYTLSAGGFTLFPMQIYLGMTQEYTETHKFVPLIEGRSSLARLGIFIHATAGFGDVGFCGNWTLEISVIRPVIIYPGMEICQIYYHKVDVIPERKYKGKYQGSRTPQPSKIFKEFDSTLPTDKTP